MHVFSLASAALLFIGTNLDDLLVLAVLYLSLRVHGRPKRWAIWVGQYIGTTVLVGLSLVGALGLTVVPSGKVWLLGALPLGLGLFKLVSLIRTRGRGERTTGAMVTGLPGIVGVTMANGGDNVGAYTPLFRTMSWSDRAATLTVFAVGLAVWCTIGAWLVAHETVAHVVAKLGEWLVPVVFIALGTHILVEGLVSP